jgi:hypothetical protein
MVGYQIESTLGLRYDYDNLSKEEAIKGLQQLSTTI